MSNPYSRVVLAAGLWCILSLSVADDGRWPVLDGGALSGTVGAAVNTTLNQYGPDAGLAWGFVEATATTPRWHGLGVGATGLGVVDLWSEQPGDFEQVFTVPTDLRELYIDLDSGTRHSPRRWAGVPFPATRSSTATASRALG